MFCQRCGTEVPENAITCPKCGATVALHTPGESASAAAERMKAASRDAFSAFRSFMGNPVAGMPAAAAALGPAKTLGAGLTFGVAFALCIVLSTIIAPTSIGFLFSGFSSLSGGLDIGQSLRTFVVALVPFVAFLAASAGIRVATSGRGGFGEDAFIAGASLLPVGAATLVMAILGGSAASLLMTFAMCFLVLMLFAGFTRITGLSERGASLAVPLVIVVSLWLSQQLMWRLVFGI